MSTTNHPNLHSVKFTTDITSSLYQSLRGKFNAANLSDEMSKELSTKILNFVNDIETLLDESPIKKTFSGEFPSAATDA